MNPRVRNTIRKIITIETEYNARRLLYSVLPLQHKTNLGNIYHCCNHKTASQWVRMILSDYMVYRASSLLPFHHAGNYYRESDFLAKIFPEGRIITPLYISHSNFIKLSKPRDYRVFFVIRDPRDVVVSLYFSNIRSHPLTEKMPIVRAKLQQMSQEEGLDFTIRSLKDSGQFEAMRSWAEQDEEDEKELIVRYEDLTGKNSLAAFSRLFSHCDIRLSEQQITKLLARYHFERLTGGRKQGVEDRSAKYRKGLKGDWKNYFTASIEALFEEAAGDLVDMFGYRQEDF